MEKIKIITKTSQKDMDIKNNSYNQAYDLYDFWENILYS